MPIASPIRALVLALSAASAGAAGADEPQKFSAAEQAIFMRDPLARLHPPTTLSYRFRRSGSLEAPFEDQVAIALTARPTTGACCDAVGEYLSGEHKFDLPPVDGATGNPVILFFLERDIREMQRLTTGKSPYFRQRIRMALSDGATERAVTIPYRNTSVAGREFTISPYLNDPNRSRFERLAGKRYQFTLSDALPGGVYSIRSVIDDAQDPAHPLIEEEVVLEPTTGAAPPRRTP